MEHKLLGISKNSRQHYTAVIGAECWSLGLLATKHWKVFTSYSRTADKHNYSSENRQFKNNSKTVLLHQTTTTTTTVLRPLYRSTCVSRHIQLRTGAFCWCTVLLPACPCWYLAYFTKHTHTRLTALFPGLPRWASTRKVKPISILLEQETVSGSGISFAVCKSAPRSRQITMPAPYH